MEYNDDILNVYALLRKKSIQNLSKTMDVAKQLDNNRSGIDDLTLDIDKLEDKLCFLAEELGLDLSYSQKVSDQDNKAEFSRPTLKIDINSDYDYKRAFELLVKEAKEEGFNHTRPENLLSEDDIRKASDNSSRIDAEFREITGLQTRDIGVLLIASAIKITIYYYNKFFLTSTYEVEGFRGVTHEGNGKNTDVDVGVDFHSINDLNSISDLLYSGDAIISKLLGEESKIVRVLDREAILIEPIPFNVSDNHYFTHKDIIGYDPIMGWLFGAVNFMTNTITTINLDSYSVINNSNGKNDVGDKLSTPVHVIFPIVDNLKRSQDSIVAAMVREADVLNVSHAPYSTVAMVMENMLNEKDKSTDLLTYAQSINPVKEIDTTQALKDSSLLAFMDMVIMAICAVMYDPKTDGNEKYYSIRLHKILLLSNAFAFIANSIPAMISEDISKIDFAGAFNTLMSLFHSTKYWIDIKTQYLVSEHKKMIDAQLNEIDKYFSVSDM